MFLIDSKKRKIAFMIFRFFIFYSIAVAQKEDSVTAIRLDLGTGYNNLISQRTASTAMDVFIKDSYLRASYADRSDTLTIGIASHRTYGRYNNSSSVWSLAVQYDVNDFWCGWSSSVGIADYVVTAGITQGKTLRPGFSATVRAKPFEGKITGEIGYSLGYERIVPTVLFQDFLIPTGEDQSVQRSYFQIALHPLEQLSLSFSSFEQHGESFEEKRQYQSQYTSNAFGRDVGFIYTFSPQWNLSGMFSIHELHPSTQINTDGVLFAEFPLGTYSRYHARIATAVEYQDIPWTFAVDRDEITLDASGIIQSWPFTSLAASVITNRFLFTLDGSLVQHQAEILSKFQLGDIVVRPALSYHYFVPDYQLKHWQPQFLVFGASNVSMERSTIVEAQLTKIDLSLEYPLWKGVVSLRFVQYIPVLIRYTATPSRPGTGTQPVISRDHDRLDGGRFIGISISY
ncbi:MAG: hypothetical protein WCW40_05560 [Bacteroidota bacterium]